MSNASYFSIFSQEMHQMLHISPFFPRNSPKSPQKSTCFHQESSLRAGEDGIFLVLSGLGERAEDQNGGVCGSKAKVLYKVFSECVVV